MYAPIACEESNFSTEKYSKFKLNEYNCRPSVKAWKHDAMRFDETLKTAVDAYVFAKSF